MTDPIPLSKEQLEGLERGDLIPAPQGYVGDGKPNREITFEELRKIPQVRASDFPDLPPVPTFPPRLCKDHGIAWCHEEIHALAKKVRDLETKLAQMNSRMVDLVLKVRWME